MICRHGVPRSVECSMCAAGRRPVEVEGECIHGMPADLPCSLCLGKPDPENVVEEVVWTNVARFEGQCNTCNLPIRPGQAIAKLSSGRYVHDGCAP